MDSQVYGKLLRCRDYIRSRTEFTPKLALVLGSGLGSFAETVDDAFSISFGEIPGFPVSTAPTHRGRFVFGFVSGVPVVVMQGRVHFYEGYPITDVVLPVRVMKLLGAEKLVLTNAAGGLNRGFSVGDLMLIRDHVSLFAPNPLIGPNLDALGTRFPDMTGIYSERMREAFRASASELGLNLREGVYAQLTGPSYESPAEIGLLAKLGIDAVGMSTVCEAIAARHAGLELCGISCISNMAAGIAGHPLSEAEVTETTSRTGAQFVELLKRGCGKLAAL